jgi:NAD(P)H-hydrate epimerase
MQEVLPFSAESKIFSPQTQAEIDRLTLERQQISSVELIERVADRLYDVILNRFGASSFTFFCGTGKNGADGLALARALSISLLQVEVYALKTTQVNSAEFDHFLNLLPVEVKWIESQSSLAIQGDYVIDALLGSGMNRAADGLLAQTIESINLSQKYVISLDIASGLGSKGTLGGAAVKPQLTLCLEAYKESFFYAENELYTGEVELVSISLDPQAKQEYSASHYLALPQDLKRLLKKRSKFAHKGTFGKALLIAGSRTMSGAAVLAALGCLRSGVGLLNVHCTQTHSLPSEALTSQDPNPEHWSVVPRDFHNYTAIGIGSGIGTHSQTLAALEATIELIENRPLVLDADALNLLHAALLKKLNPKTILTPHPKEFDRLTQGHQSSQQRLETAKEFAIANDLIVCLKGAHTATCLPDGRVVFNTTGNPGMATAGSGDVLTGVILGLLAQGYPPEQAAVLGVYLHGLSGDIAAQEHGQQGLIASDLAHNLGKAFVQLSNHKAP